MGSLPNLHEWDEIERRRERRRERELLRAQLREQRAHDSNRERERERLAMFTQRKHSAYNAYLVAGLGMGTGVSAAAATGGAAAGNAGGNSAANAAAANSATTTTTTTLSGFAVGGAALLSYGGIGTSSAAAAAGLLTTAKYWQQQQQHQHHRHSLTNRNRVLRTRSSGATHNIWDEQLMEHLAAYSPVSTRSHRINPVSSFHVQAALAASRRRESVNSSIGATSIRRLITLNSRQCRHKVPPHVRHKVWKNFTLISIGHGLICAVLYPIIGLQGSNSIWHHREQWLHVGPNIGSILLSITCLISAAMSLIGTYLIKKFGYTMLMGANYLAVGFFLLCHLYPSIFTLLPAYILLGITLCPSWISKIALTVHYGSKLSCSQHECTLSNAHAVDSLDEHKLFCNRDQKVRRLARWFQASQDLGIILGGLIASFVFACTSSDWNCFNDGTSPTFGTSFESVTVAAATVVSPNLNETTTMTTTAAEVTPPLASAVKSLPYTMVPAFLPHITGYFDDYYNLNEHGARICGADMCPVWQQVSDYTIPFNATDATNETIFTDFINAKARSGNITLLAIFFSLALVAFLLTLVVGKIQATFRHERIKGITDTLLFAGPLAYFIGTEQAYMLGDFLRAFVSCSLGISMVAGALVGMGIMQTIVSCTLSMLLRHTKRIVVILAGCFFHSCLLLTLSHWKPSSDDSALFYVIAASWGACNGMWETLLTALITINHTNHAAEVAAPLQGLRFLGLGLTFAAHGLMCETPKIVILVVILVLSVPPYTMLEIRFEAQRKANLINL